MGPESAAGIAVAGFLIVYCVILLICLAVIIAMYVLQGLAVRKMSLSCGLPHAWMGFVPFASSYRLGQLAEVNTKPGKKKIPWRHLALAGGIALTVALVVFEGFAIARMVSLAVETGGEPSVGDTLQLYGTFGVGMAFYYVIAIAYNVVIYIIYWKIFSLFTPDTAVLFLLLSIFVSASIPILLFAIRNRTPRIPDAPAPTAPGGGPSDWT